MIIFCIWGLGVIASLLWLALVARGHVEVETKLGAKVRNWGTYPSALIITGLVVIWPITGTALLTTKARRLLDAYAYGARVPPPRPPPALAVFPGAPGEPPSPTHGRVVWRATVHGCLVVVMVLAVEDLEVLSMLEWEAEKGEWLLPFRVSERHIAIAWAEAMTERAAQAGEDRAVLAHAIADAAHAAGIYNGEGVLTIPHLLLLLKDMAAEVPVVITGAP